MLIRVGDTIINLDNVMLVHLNEEHEEDEEDEGPVVVFEFAMRGWDELDEGANIAQPYLEVFKGEEAEAMRRYLKEKCPDLLEAK